MTEHEDKEYELGVREGQRGGALDDFAHGLSDHNTSYSKGYSYGANERYASNGERYHTWSNTGKNDSRNEDNSRGHVNSESNSSKSNSGISESSPYSGSSSSYSGYSGDSSSDSSEDIFAVGCLITVVLGALFIGGCYFLSPSVKAKDSRNLNVPIPYVQYNSTGSDMTSYSTNENNKVEYEPYQNLENEVTADEPVLESQESQDSNNLPLEQPHETIPETQLEEPKTVNQPTASYLRSTRINEEDNSSPHYNSDLKYRPGDRDKKEGVNEKLRRIRGY